MGSGKSAIAKKLQSAHGARVIEMDDLLAAQAGMSISEIFEKRGEEAFRDMETSFLRSLPVEDSCVVSCGGGVVLREENVRIMKQKGCIVFLDASPRTVYYRVRSSHSRPVLERNMNQEYIGMLMEKRRPFYEAAADITIHVDGKTKEQISEELWEKVKS